MTKVRKKLQFLKLTEKQIERAILEYLVVVKKIKCWKQNNGNFSVGNRYIKTCIDHMGNSVSGIPDICGYLPNGKALYIEVKRPKGKPTELQKHFLDNARESNCSVLVAHSVEEVIQFLKEEGF